MEDKKIYSLNKLSFLIMYNIDVQLVKDDTGKVYGVVDKDVSDLLDKFNTDVGLHAFLNAYRILRERIKDIR